MYFIIFVNVCRGINSKGSQRNLEKDIFPFSRIPGNLVLQIGNYINIITDINILADIGCPANNRV